MQIIQDQFYIPDDIAVGLASGLYRRLGGVVRYNIGKNKGQIVKHLDSINMEKAKDNALSVAKNVIDFGREHKGLMIGAVVVAGAIAAGGGIYAGVTAHKRKQFQKAFNRYIEAIRSGNLNLKIIEDLETSLTGINAVKMDASELSALVQHIRDYTMDLARNNGLAIDIKEVNETVVDLRQYLETQKKIFQSA